MLKPKKKITRKEIKKDALLTTYVKITSFYAENKKYISYAVTALVVIVIGIIIYVNNKKANNDKAATELGKVFAIYDGASSDVRQYKMAIDGQPERGMMGLKAIVDNYGNTESGELARFYLANAYYYLGNYDEALKQYDNFSGKNDLLIASALAGVGSCHEVKGEYLNAASSFEKATKTISNSVNTPDYLNSAARCYGLAGEKEKAITLLKRLKKEFPKSSFARDADRYISQFSV